MSPIIYFSISCIILTQPVFGHFDHYLPETRFSVYDYKTINDNYSDYILPTTLSPLWYQLTIAPNLEGGTFAGNVTIKFDVLNETDSITLNMNNDSIKLIDLPSVTADESDVQVISWMADTQREFVNFKLNKKLSPQQGASINLTYNGLLGNEMLGFYLTTYNTTNTTHLMAITQFESTYARRAFPCFDEPKYRANFSIIITHPANLTSMSNMQNISYVVDETTNMATVTYETTPPMPTYLVAFGVCDLANRTENGTFQVYARPTTITDASYVVSVGQNILDTIAKFVDIPYPLRKMDVVAVPDFDAGAMENWGLTTYREKYVLYNPQLNSWKDKFGVLSVVAHEFGHQWFGDLVTPEWWDYAWLNEAFATYFEYTVPDQIEPTWNTGSSPYVMWAVQYALDVDVETPRPMTSPVYNQSQIEAIFDYVIYEKGGSILRMSENFLTTPVWKKGLNQYLQANQYGTGTPEKLFSALQSAADGVVDVNVNETLQGWTSQPGYPLITVTLHISSNSDAVYNVTQSPYALNESLSNITWNVPLTYTTQEQQQWNSSKASKHWLLPSNSNTSSVNVNGTGWVIFNVDQVGFYRVNYDAQNWGKIKAQLDRNFTAIGSINRAQILDDAFHLARTGHLDYHVVFGLTSYLPKETNLEPWNAFFNNMRFLMNLFEGTSTGDGLKQYAQSAISKPFKSLTSNPTQTLSSFNGALILQSAASFACEVGLPDCEKMALNIFDTWSLDTTNVTVLPSDLKQTILCTGLNKNVSLDTFLLVWQYYLLSDNGAEKLTLMNAMGCVNNETAISVYLDAVCNVSANYVRLQDRWVALRALVSHQASLNTTLQYIAYNFGNVSNALGPKISTVIRTIATTISQQQHIALVKSLAADPAVDERLRNMLNTIVLPAVAKHEAWVTSPQAASLKAWVTSYTSGSESAVAINILLIITVCIFLNLY